MAINGLLSGSGPPKESWDMEQIRLHFEKVVTLSDKDWQLFSSKLVKCRFPKKALVLEVGQTEEYLSFIETGVIRFVIPHRENELTFGFAFEHSFVSAYDSFLTQTPSAYQLETLSQTVLWRLTYTDLQHIYRETKIGNTIGRFAGEELFLKKAKRELSLLNATAEERYLNLFTEQPHLLKRIPLKYIASYIGITPQALSRIRRRIS
jgi:CRP-like cAMP-binding protein